MNRNLIIAASTYDATRRDQMHDEWHFAENFEDADRIYQKMVDDGADTANLCSVIKSTDFETDRVYAAAPELMSVLQDYLKWNGTTEQLEQLEKTARTVIAKAKGETE
tara:strand:- start:2442 stop:2765 length:324 start_codon:yes stop_codon:yes gene_type:complete